jgi:deoxyuridine 5'-triphosphate nucleotidohydrolase
MESELFFKFIRTYSGKNHAILKIALTNDDINFREQYIKHIESHNQGVTTDKFPNAGFDLLMPHNTTLSGGQQHKSTLVPLDVKMEMQNNNESPTGFYMYPRSSISKTPLMLANHVGIIDSGYRGVLMAAMRNLDPTTEYAIQENTRLVQVTHPSLCPIFVKLVDESELSDTSRGSGGFGSTGL